MSQLINEIVKKYLMIFFDQLEMVQFKLLNDKMGGVIFLL